MGKKDDEKKRKSWDDMFESFDEEFEEMRRRMERLMEQLTAGSAHLDREPMIYGFSMRVGPDGRPRIQQFGNAVAENQEPTTREPLTDVIEEKDKVRIVVELPGVEKSSIHLHSTPRAMDIEVDDPDRRFTKHLELPCEVEAESAKATYKNGVLQILLRRKSPAEKRKEIRIE